MRKLFRAALALLLLATIVYLVALAALWYKQDDLLFGRRTNNIVETPQERGWAYEEVILDVPGGTTHGWWFPLDNARATVLFSHGSGRNISAYLDDVELFRELRLNVLLYDYGGYGQSTGVPSEQRCYADLRAMWDHVVNMRGIAPGNILLCGASMGSGVTTELAAQVKPRATVLESAFTSIPDTITADYPYIPARWICRSQFRSIDKIARIQSPILIVHSQADTVVPFSHGQALYTAAKEPKLFVEITGAHYGGKFSSKEAYLAGWEELLRADYKTNQGVNSKTIAPLHRNAIAEIGLRMSQRSRSGDRAGAYS